MKLGETSRLWFSKNIIQSLLEIYKNATKKPENHEYRENCKKMCMCFCSAWSPFARPNTILPRIPKGKATYLFCAISDAFLVAMFWCFLPWNGRCWIEVSSGLSEVFRAASSWKCERFQRRINGFKHRDTCLNQHCRCRPNGCTVLLTRVTKKLFTMEAGKRLQNRHKWPQIATVASGRGPQPNPPGGGGGALGMVNTRRDTASRWLEASKNTPSSL